VSRGTEGQKHKREQIIDPRNEVQFKGPALRGVVLLLMLSQSRKAPTCILILLYEFVTFVLTGQISLGEYAPQTKVALRDFDHM
jgi:hypothetical protein